MEKLAIIIVGSFLILFFFLIASMILYHRCKRKINYIIDESIPYREQLYKTFIKYFPYVLYMCGVILVFVMIKILL
ncbi:hypothetical protein GE118_01565 [Mycoplasma sp. NEAQ87857]|uniref:hypothetical protein n=1 Tax=Mycoplasma sp. NEAQ87857 TaxID=2683967 RepID=UPI001317E73B|nr:hypothetical protein [Mycoplasma sp. NEAQ87857]QGZ97483.1 hypothetical protein GE118_01565 [Mycoplasma sp. NEAQ87857]